MVDPFSTAIALDSLEEIPRSSPPRLGAFEEAHEFVGSSGPDRIPNLAVSGQAPEMVSAPPIRRDEHGRFRLDDRRIRDAGRLRLSRFWSSARRSPQQDEACHSDRHGQPECRQDHQVHSSSIGTRPHTQSSLMHPRVRAVPTRRVSRAAGAVPRAPGDELANPRASTASDLHGDLRVGRSRRVSAPPPRTIGPIRIGMGDRGLGRARRSSDRTPYVPRRLLA